MSDQFNSTVGMMDSSQSLLNNNTYTPYGINTKHNSSYASSHSLTSVDTNYTFTGREDDGNGLMYYRNRYYSSTMKRFISEDPIGLQGGLNQYAYVMGNPLAFNDPYGLLQRDPITGEVLFYPTGDKTTYTHGVGNDTQHIRFWQILGYIKADDGTHIPAYKTLNGNYLSSKGFNLTYDCHGLTFTEGQLWIDNDDAPNIIKGDGYHQVTGMPLKGDIVVYYKNGEVVHSGVIAWSVINGVPLVEQKGGVEPFPSINIITPGNNGAWSDPSSTYKVYRK